MKLPKGSDLAGTVTALWYLSAHCVWQVVELGDSEGHLTRKLIERLFTSSRSEAPGEMDADNLIVCWEVTLPYPPSAYLGDAGR